ncbi:hypothetical protein [Actinomadura sp. 3N407]|uniref:hypothetical protein n=1 Tax=Actinomadura sp. 3N407 TaxID=3457423 RepID=UPI003FCD157D
MSNPQHPPPAPRGSHAEVVQAMLADLDLTHGRLLLGLAAVLLHAEHGVVSWKQAARAAAYRDSRFTETWCPGLDGEPATLVEHGGHLGWLQKMIKLDRPRYEQPTRHAHHTTCDALTSRKARCGRPMGSGLTFDEPDQQTGEKYPRTFCHKHRHVGDALYAEIQRRPTPPKPAANRGGILARHIDTDWPRLYQWADPSWTQPPADPLPQARPRLTVLVTHETTDAPASDSPRPGLSVVQLSVLAAGNSGRGDRRRGENRGELPP